MDPSMACVLGAATQELGSPGVGIGRKENAGYD
jgi:hypothetical protein